MKNIFIILVVCLFLPVQAFAHPARKITLSISDKTLNIKITHKVNNSQKHYINRITVYVNKKNIIQQKFSAQISDTEQVVFYTIPSLKIGDIIVVETNCSRFGKRKKSITIR